MVSSPIVSVILPFFNAGAYLRDALRSIADQTLQEFETLLIDDGSEDSSGEVARDFAAQDSRFRVLPRTHAGIVSALQQGCAAARAPYLARMDADDVAYPNRLREQLKLMTSHPRLAVCGTLVHVTGLNVGSGRRRYEAWVNSLVSSEEHRRELLVECPIPHPTFFMRRETFDAVGGYHDCPWPEDYDLLLRLHTAGYAMAKVPEVLLEWRDRPGRLSMTDPRYSDANFRALKRRYLLHAIQHSDTPFYQWGAGEVGKRWLREWGDRPPLAVVDLHPRKLGLRIHGVPVVPPEGLPPPGNVFIVVAVGARGARDEIRAWLAVRGHKELADFVFVA